MDDENSDAIVRHAFCEQRQLNLNWYNSITAVKNRLEVEESKPLIWPNQIRAGLKNWFKRIWNTERSSNNKLKFYNSIKPDFKEELYLRLDLNSTASKRIAQLRSSSHNLNIETGRYGANRLKLINRVCKHCCTDDEGTLDRPAESSPNVLVVRAGWRQREVRWAQPHCFWQGLANPNICGVY